MPGAFLPAAERYHQIVGIDRWVVGQCLQLLGGGLRKFGNGRLAINLSAQALADENFLDFVVEEVTKNGVAPSGICFEIHENAAIADFRNVRQFIAVLKELGCLFALDDFGAGLSSFAYLKNLAVDFLKIDGHLVKDMLKNPVDQSMVESIHRIGHVMGLKTVAEWVETPELSQALEDIGVDYGQGFRLGKPRAVDAANG
jgi:EAL domain-containing protein (putative c-di-GMP-specific phosphodiesterase class I)